MTVSDGRNQLTEWAEEHTLHQVPMKTETVPDDEPCMELEEVWFRYEKDTPDILKSVSMKAYPGELFCILGGNGTGKSTTLSILSGVRKPYRGKRICRAKKVVALPQNPQMLLVKKNVREELLSAFLKGYDGGWIYEINAMPEDPFIYVEEKPYVEPRYPGIELTWEEQQLLAKVIWVEARGESAEGQQAIAEVVFNRMLSEEFPDTLRGVIFAENQFRSVEFLDDAEPWQAQYDAIDDALEGPYVLPVDVYYFATYAVNENVWGRIGGHIFCYQSAN